MVSLAAHDVVNEGVGGVRVVVFGDRMHAFILRLMHVELKLVSKGVHVLRLLVEVPGDEHVHVWELAFDQGDEVEQKGLVLRLVVRRCI